jgi:hypothetical protein
VPQDQPRVNLAKAVERQKTAPIRRPRSKDDVRVSKPMTLNEPVAKIARALGGRRCSGRPPARPRPQRQSPDHALGALPQAPDREGQGVGKSSPRRRWRRWRRFCGPLTTPRAGSASRPMRRSPRPPIAPARRSPRRSRRLKRRASSHGSSESNGCASNAQICWATMAGVGGS